MSLRVWLPLNGNLENQGLDTVNMTNAGPTVDSNGKIGSCYKFGGFLYYNYFYLGSKDFSVCYWVKYNWIAANDSFVVSLNNFTATDYQFMIGGYGNGIDNSATSTYLRINGESSGTIPIPVGEWHHCCATWKGTTVSLYVDGIFDKKITGVSVNLGAPHLNINCRSNDFAGAGISYTGSSELYLNDVRIYDHCLSAKEVKEISKGLICHYKLADPYIESTTNYSSQSASSDGWNNSGSSVRNNNDTSVNRVSSDCPVLSIQQTAAGNSAITFGNVSTSTYTALKGATVTASVYAYISDVNCSSNVIYLRSTVNDSKTGNNICDFQYNGSTNPQNWPKNQWIRIEGTGTIVSTETAVYFCTYTNNLNEKRYFTCWQLELKDHSTPFVVGSRDESIVYDCSGIANNGTKIGGVLPSSNPLPIRYEKSYDFDGNTGSIQTPNLSTLVPSGEFTMNCWIYHDNTWSSKAYETIFGGPSGFELEAKVTSTNSPVLWAYSWGQGSATYELNKWNMITMTRNASEAKFYINGELKITGSAGTIPSGNYFIGAWNTSSGQNYKGRISDFRLYSTVLSVEDIKALYNTPASIDKNGNMYAYEFKEE